jgi:ATP phosphoribosyltransferase
MLVRSQEMATYVEDGVFDAGLTGKDWIMESGAKVKEVCELLYAKSGFRPVRWVLCVPEASPIKSVKDLQGKRIATEVVNIVKKYLAKNKVKAKVEFSWGATEAKAGRFVDAIVELTETGSSLRANRLRIVEELLTSSTRLICNEAAWKDSWKRQKIENLAMLLQGALAAEGLVGIKMNLREEKLSTITSLLPALRKPTISQLTEKGWVALEVIMPEKELKKITKSKIKLTAEEVKTPEIEAQLVADYIARQLKRRLPYRKIVLSAVNSAMDRGAKGIKIKLSGLQRRLKN